MTTLTEKDVIGMARTIADQDKVDPYLNGMVPLTTEELIKFRNLCRADLVAEVERLKADAARYRWLRSTTNWASSKGERIDVRNCPELWDEAIDAALQGEHS